MSKLHAEFMLGATQPEQFPTEDIPQFAFIGRSNVGKSSLLNNLVHRKNLAHVSGAPGKTQQINFFRVDKWIFADMPGLGYAKVSKSEREKWKKLNDYYLLKSKNLCMTFYLIDSRHDPQNIDLGMIEWMELHERRYFIILTKRDKIKEGRAKERVEQLREIVQYCNYCEDVLLHSSVSSVGRNEIYGAVKRVGREYYDNLEKE